MRSESDFWYVLHQLAGEVQREAKADRQCGQLAEQLKAQHVELRSVNCANLEYVGAVIRRLLDECGNMPTQER